MRPIFEVRTYSIRPRLEKLGADCLALVLGFSILQASPLLAVNPELGDSAESLRFSPVVRAIQNVEPGVVDIQGNKTISSANNNSKQEVNGMGTGVIIDPRGYIITNLHVVQDVSKIEVTLHNGSKTEAKLINFDPETDLAMIRIRVDQPLPTIPIGSSRDLMRGEEVIAIGNPFGYQHTVTKGIVSAMHRDIPVNGTQEYKDLIQTNADINPGNSGGPLVNIAGEVIGINVAVRIGAQGIGFAIPIDAACEVIADLLANANESTATHGLSLRTIHRDDRLETVIADSVLHASTRSSSSMLPGDKIVSVNGRSIQRRMDVELSLLESRASQSAEFVIERNGSRFTVDHPISRQNTTVAAKLSDDVWEKLGLRLVEVTGQTLAKTGDNYSGGLKVLAVRDQSPAQREDIMVGDIIVGALRWQTPDMGALEYVVNRPEFTTASSVKFFVVRNNETRFAALKMDQAARVR